MKNLLIGDLHFGEKQDSEKFNCQIIEFLEWACDIGKEYNVDNVIQLGDWFHGRNRINVLTLHYGILGAQKLSEQFGKESVYVLEGNHDLYYRDRVDVSSVSVFGSYVTLIDKPTVIDNIVLTPWVVDGQMWDEVVNLSNENDYLYAHLELNGFMVNDRYTMEHGHSPKELRDYKRVMTGHYHSPQNQKNIWYTGSPYPITMNEANEPHGVYVHDTETDDLEFIEYEKIKVVSIPYNRVSEVENYDKDNTTIRIEYPDDLEDERLIEETQQELLDKGFQEVKSKYRGKKAADLLDNEVEVEEVDNIDELVLTFIKDSNEISGIDPELLEKWYQKAKNYSEQRESVNNE